MAVALGRCPQCGCPNVDWPRLPAVARASGLQERHLRNLCARGEILARKLGNVWQVSHAGWHEFLARSSNRFDPYAEAQEAKTA